MYARTAKRQQARRRRLGQAHDLMGGESLGHLLGTLGIAVDGFQALCGIGHIGGEADRH